MDPAHGYRWLCILVGCVFFLFSILDFPLIWYYLYNLIWVGRVLSKQLLRIGHTRVLSFLGLLRISGGY